MNGVCNGTFLFGPAPLGPGEGPKGQISLNIIKFQLQSQLQRFFFFFFFFFFQGAQWLSGRVLDSRPKGRGFEPHRRHCVVVLEQDTFILA